jgi:hypothetical protein
MILLELSTESGAVYVANVVNQRIRRIAPDGTKGDWMDYKEIQGGEPGQRMFIHWPEGEPTLTTPIVKLNHAYVE